MDNSNNVNNFNLNASTSIAFRFLQIHNQLNHNCKNMTNQALKGIVYEIVCRIYKIYVNMKDEEKNSDEYLYFANKLFEYFINQKMFLTQLCDVLDKECHDYNIIKYCILVMDSTEYILGNDEIDEPED